MTSPHGWVIHRYDRVTSTMDVAARLAQFGASDRTAVISGEQSAGRGRGGKVWESPPGTALFCTMLLRPRVAPARLSTLPLVAGLAVAEAIELLTGCPTRIKWPNDVWIGNDGDRRKVAGILVTSHASGGEIDHALIGIGVNIAVHVEALPPGATSIQAATGLAPTVDAVFAKLLERFDHGYASFQESNGRPSLDGWRARAVLLGDQVTIDDMGRQLVGVFVGIEEDGALLLQESDSTIRRVVAGELTRGPRAMLEAG